MEMAVFGDHEEKTLSQLAEVAKRAVRVALMADGHLGYVMPIGGVAAYREQVSVVGVGFDIACGNCALRTNMSRSDLGDRNRIADEIQQTISFGLGRSNRADDAPVDHPLFDSPSWDALPRSVRSSLRNKAREQLGTVGSGNHYVDIFADEDDRIWVGVHFGSRGLGHTIASGFLALGQGQKWGERVPEAEVLLPLDSELGQSYWALMELSGEYAYAGREWVAWKVAELLGAEVEEMVHNHHNFAWREQHDDEELIVVRKGATPAFPGQKSFIGGSMGDMSVIVEGRRDGSPEVVALQQAALYSTVHGAGRVMSRTQAAGRRRRRTGEVIKPGLITPQMLERWLREKDVVLRGGGLDEAPQVYRRLSEVLDAQGETITILHRMKPLIVVMAGANEFDPYKD